MRKARHVEDLTPLRQKGPHVGPGIHWPGQNIRVFLGRLRLADETAKDTGKSYSLLHGAAWRSRGQSLQMKRKIVLDRSAGLNRLDLESGANVGEHRGPKG